jgi:hypothetical protein
MSDLQTFLKSLLPTIHSQHERDEAFLAGAVDMCDLERRLHEIDDRASRQTTNLAVGLYAR